MAQSIPPSDDDPTRTDRQPRKPTVGDDPRDAKETADPPGKVWFRDLDEAVIEADRCIQCGSCVAACPSDSLGIDGLEETEAVTSLADWNRRRVEASLERDLDPEGDLTIGYEEQRANADGTDREPELHNPAQAYQYERWC